MIVESIMASGLKLPSKKFINDNSNDHEYFELLRRSVIAAIPEIKPEGETGIKLTTHSGTYSLGCVSFLPFAIEDLKEMNKLGSPSKEGRLLSVNQLISKFKNHGVKVTKYPFEKWEKYSYGREDLANARKMVSLGWEIIVMPKDRKRVIEGNLPKEKLMFKKGRLYLSTGDYAWNSVYAYKWELSELKDVFVKVDNFEGIELFMTSEFI